MTPLLKAQHTRTTTGRLMRQLLPLTSLVTLCLWNSGCAEEDAVTTVTANADMSDSLDMGSDTLDATPDLPEPDLPVTPEDMPGGMPDLMMDMGGMDMSDGQDAAPDMPPPPTISYALCALGQRAPWGECLEEDTLEFGRVPAAQLVERLARLDNDGEVAITVTRSMFSQMEYQVTWRTYDRGQPAMATEQALPFTIEPGESLFAAVTLFGGLTMAQLPDTQLEISVDTGGADLETVTLELKATYEGCALGLASCDMDIMNGCEVNVTNDVMHCGGCNMPCDLPNATPQCAGSACLIQECDEGFGSCDGSMGTGCETDTDTSMEHCGGCGLSCGYDNASAQCDQGSCVFQGCLGTFENCDNDLDTTGCETDTNTSLAHCGGCDQPCDFANADETCSTGNCVFQGCQNNYYNLDGDLSNGCEYFCVAQGPTDLPDSQYVDANCDGIDGDISEAVFVARTGDDGNAGTMGSPFRTIGKALNVASTTSGISQILVASGDYEEQIFLVNGTHIAGGYETTTGWQRSLSATTRAFWRQAMSRRIVAMSGTNITSTSSVSQMTVEAESTTAAGTSTYGIYCNGCTGLTLTDNIFIAGDAGAGADGMNGAVGLANTSTGTGRIGGAGSCDGSGNRQGGTGGTSACGRNGGRGGNGGSEGDNSGVAGSPGLVGTSGGAGGREDNCGHRDGANGTDGTDGNNGGHGSAGIGGALQSGYWVADDGANGSNGSHGNGGGGGGGGSGQGGTFCDNGAGNGGGGGGAGGCGGSAGTSGRGGGSSFAAFLYQSTGIILSGNSMRASNGGAGGTGGTGGNGSTGRSGGSGGSTCTGEVGRGGNGGAGGDGGDGGHGGGGAGGNSYAIWRESTTVGLPGSNILTFGQAGAGGNSQGNSGSPGIAGTYR